MDKGVVLITSGDRNPRTRTNSRSNRKSFILPRGVKAVVRKIWNKGKEEGSGHQELRAGKSVVAETEMVAPESAALAEGEDRVSREDKRERVGMGVAALL